LVFKTRVLINFIETLVPVTKLQGGGHKITQPHYKEGKEQKEGAASKERTPTKGKKRPHSPPTPKDTKGNKNQHLLKKG